MRPIDISTFDRLARYLRREKASLVVTYGGLHNPKGWVASLSRRDVEMSYLEIAPTMMDAIKRVVSRWEERNP